VQEEVAAGVGVVGDQVRRGALERDDAAVGRQRGADAEEVRLVARGVDADARRRRGRAVAHEDVAPAVGVAEDEVRGGAVERDEVAVGRERGRLAPVVSRDAVEVDADTLGRAEQPVAQEDVGVGVAVVRVEVRREAHERDAPAVRRERGAQAVGVPVESVPVDADALRHAGRAIVDEDVARVVGVAGDEVVREAVEGDEPSVRRDHRVAGETITLVALAVDAHELRRAGDAVADEDVEREVQVDRHEVVGAAHEDDDRSIGRDRLARRHAADAVRLGLRRIDADPLDRARGQVAHEDVAEVVGVARDQVGREALEDDPASVGRDRLPVAREVAFVPRRIGADPRRRLRLRALSRDCDRQGDPREFARVHLGTPADESKRARSNLRTPTPSSRNGARPEGRG
jgi:hypothetical protein